MKNEKKFEKINVHIIGGGVAGMSVAHELIKKTIDGKSVFNITIYEKDPEYVGGKARSIYHMKDKFSNTENSNKYLPGEHGFRFFPGFYCSIPQTFQEIPIGGDKTVADNLVQTSTYMFTFNDEKRRPVELIVRNNEWNYFGSIQKMMSSYGGANVDITQKGKLRFAYSLYRMMTSSYLRKSEEYERLSWLDFIDAENPNYGKDYKKFCANGITRSLIAAKSNKASIKTGSLVVSKMLLEIIAPYGKAGRVLNGPTNEAWLNHWYNHLTRAGHNVKYLKNAVCEEIKMKCNSGEHNYMNGQSFISSIRIKHNGIDEDVNNEDDKTMFVFAVPVECMGKLLLKSGKHDNLLFHSDPTLKYIMNIDECVDWMSGIVFFLKTKDRIEITAGHINLIDSAWAITAIHQDQFWADKYAAGTFGNKGEITGILSFDMCNCDQNSDCKDKRAMFEMTRADVISEAWEQIKKCPLIKTNEGYRCLTDADIFYEYTYLDEALKENDRDVVRNEINEFLGESYPDFSIAYEAYKIYRNSPDKEVLDKAISFETFKKKQDKRIRVLRNEMPLLINSVNTFPSRPATYTNIENMFLAGDYIRTEVDLATMEGANESGKRAANSIIRSIRMNKKYNKDGVFNDLKETELPKYTDPLLKFKTALYIISLLTLLASVVHIITSLWPAKYTMGHSKMMISNNIVRSLNNISHLTFQMLITLFSAYVLVRFLSAKPSKKIILYSLLIMFLLLSALWIKPIIFSMIVVIVAWVIALIYFYFKRQIRYDEKIYREGKEWQLDATHLIPFKIIQNIVNKVLY